MQQILNRLKGPAIGLMTSAIFNALWSLIFLFSNAITFLKENSQNFANESEKIAGTFGYTWVKFNKRH